MPNSDEGKGQSNYPKFEIGLGELVTKLEFNPMEVIKEYENNDAQDKCLLSLI